MQQFKYANGCYLIEKSNLPNGTYLGPMFQISMLTCEAISKTGKDVISIKLKKSLFGAVRAYNRVEKSTNHPPPSTFIKHKFLITTL